jgi:hypothetical protein
MHLWGFCFPVLFITLPYYAAAIHLQTLQAKQQSIIVLDGVCAIASFQAKMVLSVVSAHFGECYPFVLLCTMLVAALSQLLLMLRSAGYSSVLAVNTLRITGFAIATVNGMFAIWWHLSNGGLNFNTCTNSSDLGTSSGSYGPAESFLKADYVSFIAMIGFNAAIVICSICYFCRKRRIWQMDSANVEESYMVTESDSEELNSSTASLKKCTSRQLTREREVDLPIVKGRVLAALAAIRDGVDTAPALEVWLSEEGNSTEGRDKLVRSLSRTKSDSQAVIDQAVQQGKVGLDGSPKNSPSGFWPSQTAEAVRRVSEQSRETLHAGLERIFKQRAQQKRSKVEGAASGQQMEDLTLSILLKAKGVRL